MQSALLLFKSFTDYIIEFLEKEGKESIKGFLFTLIEKGNDLQRGEFLIIEVDNNDFGKDLKEPFQFKYWRRSGFIEAVNQVSR